MLLEILPETIMALLCVMLIIASIRIDAIWLTTTAIIGILAIIVIEIIHPHFNIGVNGFVLVDGLSYFLRLVVLGLGLITLAFNEYEKRSQVILSLLAMLGMLIMISSNDFLSTFLGLELQSLSLYLLAANERNSSSSLESAIKYFILGAIASAVFLYGLSLVYGFSSTTKINELIVDNVGVKVGICLIAVGLLFKIAIVPFHMWLADLYQGLNEKPLMFLVVLPKIASFAVLWRINLHVAVLDYIFAILGVASIIIGGLLALRQTNIRRLLGYSSVAHMGYVLLGIVPQTNEASILYLFIYCLTLMGILWVIFGFNYTIQDIKDLTGLGRMSPSLGLLLAFFLLSMAGIPPFPGFLAKFLVLRNLLVDGWYATAILAIIGSVIGAAYVLIILQKLLVENRENIRVLWAPRVWGASALCLILLSVLIMPDLWFSFIDIINS